MSSSEYEKVRAVEKAKKVERRNAIEKRNQPVNDQQEYIETKVGGVSAETSSSDSPVVNEKAKEKKPAKKKSAPKKKAAKKS